MRLILASSSPRRRELLRAAGLRFRAQASSIEPPPRRGESAAAYARRAARAKALDVAGKSPRGALVLAADTVVVVNGKILGKPRDRAAAARMLRKLSGRTHRVLTGVCLAQAPRRILALQHETTRVRFRKLGEAEIQDYLASGEPFDKAGAYAIQGLASKFVTRIEGCYFNVVGLPVPMVYEMLRAAR
jgi:nucleoside triphosphate pyrophosphatase